MNHTTETFATLDANSDKSQGRHVDEASPWSLSFVMVVPLAPLAQ